MLAQHSESGRVVALQVKTATTNVFRLGLKEEQPAHEQNEWFVLVALGKADARPRYFVLPTDVIAGWLYVGHRVWLEGAKRDGTPHKDTAIRAIRMDEIDAVYEEAWDLLNAPRGQRARACSRSDLGTRHIRHRLARPPSRASIRH